MTTVAEGDVLAGKYRVERVIGAGGMGIVVAAIHTALDERVALKLMRPAAMEREGGIQRFVREARAAVKLKSDHVARVHDVGTLDDGTPYIVMEHLEGSDLAAVIASRGRLPLDEAVDYVLQACDAIAEAHALGIVHRDLKPGNLFVTTGRDGSPLVKVLDFGISKLNVLGDRPESVTNSQALLGSPAYMSPEQMKSSRDVGATADIWSIGVILFEAVSGRLPFLETTLGGLMAKVLTEPPPLHVLGGDLPPEFKALLGRCLARDTGERPASVVELAVALAPFGSPSSTERVSRISSLRPSAKQPVSAANASLSPLAATQHPSFLGVASTQIDADARFTTEPSERRNGRRLPLGAMALLGLGAVAVSFLVTRGTPAPSSAAPGAASQETTRDPGAPAPIVAPAPVEPASAAPAPPSTAAPLLGAESGAPSSPPAAREKPTVTSQPAPPSPPASSANADAGDPFGRRRY
jgi:serine/threonine-protein kinase